MKHSQQIVGLRRQLVDLARAELARREEEEVDPAVVEAARAELERMHDLMAENLAAHDRFIER